MNPLPRLLSSRLSFLLLSLPQQQVPDVNNRTFHSWCAATHHWIFAQCRLVEIVELLIKFGAVPIVSLANSANLTSSALERNWLTFKMLLLSNVVSMSRALHNRATYVRAKLALHFLFNLKKRASLFGKSVWLDFHGQLVYYHAAQRRLYFLSFP